MADMRNGYVPRLEQVEKFARGFGLDVNAWRAKAGYEAVEPAPGNESPLQRLHRLRDAFAAYCARLGAGEPAVPFASVGAEIPDNEYADDLLRSVVESHAEDYPQYAERFLAWFEGATLPD